MSVRAHTCVCVQVWKQPQVWSCPSILFEFEPLVKHCVQQASWSMILPTLLHKSLGSRQEVRNLALRGPGFQTQTPILPQQALCPLSLLCTPVQCFWKWDCWLARWLSGYRWLCEARLLEFHPHGLRGGRKELWLLWLSSNLCPLAHASLCHTK